MIFSVSSNVNALSELNSRSRRIAGTVAAAGTNDNSQSSQDPAQALVELTQVSSSYSANLDVIATSSDLAGALLDIRV